MKIEIDIPNENTISGTRVVIDGEEVSKGWKGIKTKQFVNDIKKAIGSEPKSQPTKAGSI